MTEEEIAQELIKRAEINTCIEALTAMKPNQVLIAQRDKAGYYHVWVEDGMKTLFCLNCGKPFGKESYCQNCGNDEFWTG